VSREHGLDGAPKAACGTPQTNAEQVANTTTADREKDIVDSFVIYGTLL
jgi:hypothetical protein